MTNLTATTELTARAAIHEIGASKIREVANAGIGRRDVTAFWFGEPDRPTPEFICRAASEALAAGDTFYTHNLGIAPLRETISAYVSRLHAATGVERIAVTSSGMSALMVLTQALVGPGDRVVAITPLWPNLTAIPQVLGARVVRMPLRFSPAGWSLDIEHAIAALTPGTRALYVNSPNNPTGWTIDRGAQTALLEHCRRLGIWIIADDAYERLFYGASGVAPSFLDLADADDRVVSANTFSKSWLMTGWRLGWIVAPPALIDDLGKLIEYNTSCAPGFVQRAGQVAMREGDALIAETLERFRRARDLLIECLRTTPRVQAALPPGAMYAFFKVEGVADSLAFCKRLVSDHGLGLAPGSAFGAEGEGFVRWCFAADERRIEQGIELLRRALRNDPV